MSKNEGKVKRIGHICVSAINDQRKKIESEYQKQHGKSPNVSFLQASDIVGIKYQKMHFGRLSLDEVNNILTKRRRRRRR